MNTLIILAIVLLAVLVWDIGWGPLRIPVVNWMGIRLGRWILRRKRLKFYRAYALERYRADLEAIEENVKEEEESP